MEDSLVMTYREISGDLSTFDGEHDDEAVDLEVHIF